MTIEDVERDFVDRLVEAVPGAVAADPPPVVPACLVLLYSPGQFAVLPSALAFPMSEGFEGIVRLLADVDFHESQMMEDSAPELFELACYLDQTRLPDERAQALLNEASRRLNGLDWRSRLAVADDFLVFATDMEQCHLEENLRVVTTDERATRILDALR
ncbi:hypothetical protein ACGFNU_07335 [Spirillospora sp. NPDC048911]|uniref:hypothetical protein n=1 Tax=Spirillospora sp. NPDC048911 TaxID=3364527 RepID=UPI0037240A9C